MQITVLCKVVDNFGDIGVVYRLCKQLFFVNNQLNINLVVDDLVSFNKICSQVNPSLDFQKIQNINVYNWNKEDFCYKEFLKNDGEKLEIILECFQCGRPNWMEKILFEDKLNRTCHIIMIDYLTAEKYAEDFHCLQSLTRSAKVQKVNFMPGFTEKTGGLIIDNQWKNVKEYNPLGPVLIFTYEKKWDSLVKALNTLNNKKIFLAQGRGFNSFYNSWNSFGKDNTKFNELKTLDYLNQNEWDKMMQECSILFIRGEESMSRACLSGIPFVWHAYPQSDEYQLVKVNALLERMRKYFSNDQYEIIKNLWIDFNIADCSDQKLYSDSVDFINNYLELQKGFSQFAQDIRKNGDLATNLMTFINKIAII